MATVALVRSALVTSALLVLAPAASAGTARDPAKPAYVPRESGPTNAMSREEHSRSAAPFDGPSGSFSLEFPPNFDGPVLSTLEAGSSLYIGGRFFTAGEGPDYGITRLEDGTWHSMQNGIFSWTNVMGINCLRAYQGSIIATGHFTSIGSVPATCIARWDGAAWTALSSGLGGLVFNPEGLALAEFEGDLIVGGDFTAAGGIPAFGIASWNGTAWSPLGVG